MNSETPLVSLRDAGVKLIDCVHKTPSAAEHGFPYIAIPQLSEGRVDVDSARRISEQDMLEWNVKCNPQEDDIILSRRCNPGVTAVIPKGFRGSLGQNLVLLRATDANLLTPKYLRWVTRGSEWWNEVDRYINVGAVFESLRCADIPEFAIPVPSIPEQWAIAHILGTLDDKIELNRKTNETLEAMAKALFKSWFVDFDPVRAKAEGRPTGLPAEISDLFPDSFEDSELGEIPSGWRVETVGDISSNFDSKRVPVSGNDREKRKGEYPYYGATGVVDWIDNFLFDGVYLLIGEDGSVERSDGTAFSQYVSGKIWVNNHAHVLTGAKEISTEHLYLYFQFIQVAPFVTGAVQLKISQGRLNSIPVVTAPPPLNDCFSGLIRNLFGQKIAIGKEISTLALLRDALLPKLISGEIRIPDADKMLEEVGV
jgi:type I restriction enzyme S subunit